MNQKKTDSPPEITVRKVNPVTHLKLKLKAKARDMTLTGYLRQKLNEIAEEEDEDEMLPEYLRPVDKRKAFAVHFENGVVHWVYPGIAETSEQAKQVAIDAVTKISGLPADKLAKITHVETFMPPNWTGVK